MRDELSGLNGPVDKFDEVAAVGYVEDIKRSAHTLPCWSLCMAIKTQSWDAEWKLRRSTGARRIWKICAFRAEHSQSCREGLYGKQVTAYGSRCESGEAATSITALDECAKVGVRVS